VARLVGLRAPGSGASARYGEEFALATLQTVERHVRRAGSRRRCPEHRGPYYTFDVRYSHNNMKEEYQPFGGPRR
jgi:hypothetical protein